MGWQPYYCTDDCSCKRHTRQPKNHQHINQSYTTYKYNSAKKKRLFKLTKDEFYDIVIQNCHYCNQVPEKKNSRRYKIAMNGIDRIDSSKDYTLDNVVPCCLICNLLKGKLPKIDFISHVRRIYENTFQWTPS